MDQTPFTILIVDDEVDIREVLEIALMDMGHEVLLAPDGKKALELFDEHHPDIVITDIKMPVMGGIDLLKQVKRRFPDTPVIMITGHGDMDLTIASLNSGFGFHHQACERGYFGTGRDQSSGTSHRPAEAGGIHPETGTAGAGKSKLSDHLSSLGLMLGTVSHNIKGLLTNLDGGLFVARSGLKKKNFDDVSEGLDLLSQAVDKVKQMIMDILLYSKERSMIIQSVPLDSFVTDIRKTMKMKLAGHSIDFQVVSDNAPATLNLDPSSMMSALVNILDNAVDACLEDKGQAGHVIRLTIEEKDSQLVIGIRDDGCGMDVATKAKIFDLFFLPNRSRARDSVCSLRGISSPSTRAPSTWNRSNDGERPSRSFCR